MGERTACRGIRRSGADAEGSPIGMRKDICPSLI